MPARQRFDGGRNSVGRVPDCDSSCRGLESRRPPHSCRERLEPKQGPKPRDVAHDLIGDEAAQRGGHHQKRELESDIQSDSREVVAANDDS